MEEDDDDFYGGRAPDLEDVGLEEHVTEDVKDEKMEDHDEEEDEEGEESDDDVQFTLEKPEGPKSESPAQSRPTRQTASQDRAVSSEAKPARTETPLKQEARSESTQPTAVKGTLTHDAKEGKDFPGIRTSKLDVNGIPTWPGNGKPVTELDIDADLAEHSKPWRLPGTDQTDFFNYGFDEYTWAQYCLRQQNMSNTISDQKQADAQMKAMFGSGGTGAPGGGSGMPPGMPPMPGMSGMPSPEEMMQQMMAAGLNPADQNQFMQFMMSGGMPGGGQGQQNQQQGGGFGQQGPNFGGSNQNSASPHPQGQGFQPPQGPAAQSQHGDQGGFQGNVEGYSPQQLAIMQQQQGGMGGQSGGRGRGNRRGRGYY